jgi:hypothetical protein
MVSSHAGAAVIFWRSGVWLIAHILPERACVTVEAMWRIGGYEQPVDLTIYPKIAWTLLKDNVHAMNA